MKNIKTLINMNILIKNKKIQLLNKIMNYLKIKINTRLLMLHKLNTVKCVYMQ